MSDYYELATNSIILIISATAVFAYMVLINLFIFSHRQKSNFLLRFRYWEKSLNILISSLPLLGLLGTITGLMQTFFALSINRSMDLQSLMSAGIASAMFSTQFGLALAIPGYIFIYRLRAIRKRIRLIK